MTNLEHSRLAVILLGRGSTNTPRAQMTHMLDAVRATGRYMLVCSALVDQGEPSLPTALDACAATGAQRVLVVPVFIPNDQNLHQWLAKVVRRWQATAAGEQVAVVFGATLADHPALCDAVVRATVEAEQGVDVRDAPPRQWEHNPTGWSVLPAHERHVLLCRGPRCTAMGAGELWAGLDQRLRACGLRGGDERVLTVGTGCLYPCNHGPVMVVYPEGMWYGGLDDAALDQIVAEHFGDGCPVETYRLRSTSQQSTDE